MRTVTIKQIDLQDEGKHVAVHRFEFPNVGDPAFYRSVISYGAFFDSPKARNRSDRYLFRAIDPYPAPGTTRYELSRDAALPVIRHADLYAFFTAVGYDRKRKKLV